MEEVAGGCEDSSVGRKVLPLDHQGHVTQQALQEPIINGPGRHHMTPWYVTRVLTRFLWLFMTLMMLQLWSVVVVFSREAITTPLTFTWFHTSQMLECCSSQVTPAIILIKFKHLSNTLSFSEMAMTLVDNYKIHMNNQVIGCSLCL